jgi:hypothetical protein
LLGRQAPAGQGAGRRGVSFYWFSTGLFLGFFRLC